MKNNQYGHYLTDGSGAFCIHTADIPRHWYNYIWNDSYIAFLSQVGFGEGFCQDSMGNRINLIKNRNLYLIDANTYWTANGLSVDKEYIDYSCVHEIGCSTIRLTYNDIYSEYRVFVPEREKCEIWTLKLKNVSSYTKKLRAVAYASTDIDGAYTPQGYNLSTGGFEKECGAVVGNIFACFDTKEEIPMKGYMTCIGDISGYDSRKNAFIGTYGTEHTPKAISKNGGCTNSACNGEKLCFAIQSDIILEPGEKKEIAFICGVEHSLKDIAAVKQRYATMALIDAELDKVKNGFKDQEQKVRIDTPVEQLNMLMNYWLPHQTNMGSRWARVRHNGYRDIVSDSDCLSVFNPGLALERFKRILTYQYSSGYAPRTFIDGKIKDNNFSDNAVWIAMTLLSLLNELGDRTILDEIVMYNDGSEGTVYEHAKRAVDFLYRFRGLHNLIKIWGGDWNDCMNRAGLDGKGVSVWLSMAWYRANQDFAEIARIHGSLDDVMEALARAGEMKTLINKYGWDGEYYLTAYKDNGEKIGSKSNSEGKIFLIPQLWSILSGVAADGKGIAAMQSVEKYLDSPLGTKISWPPYSVMDNSIGTVTHKPAGVHENGGVYLHTMAWKLAVDCILKRADNAEETLQKILPFTNTCVDGKAEPYILCNSYFGEETGYRYSTPGQSWRSASGPWLAKALLIYVFGIKPSMEGLKIDPCLPPSWSSCSVEKKFRKANYNISYINNGVSVEKITVNGEEIQGSLLPYVDGVEYDVVVYTSGN
ncbi:MAG: hypothetical protein IJ365_01550 [Clostridia bacterium]|nr:hypothetical protein [Clostridia bacterium]